MEDSDDEYDRLSELSLSDPDSETEDLDAPQNTPATTPPSSSVHEDTPRDKQKRFACTYDNCPKAFNRPARLEEHLRSHTNDRAFKCPYKGCSKTYLRDSHLKHHVKSAHTKVRDYKCTWDGCDKAFATGTRLKNHLLVHEGHEKFRCRGFADCSQTFRKKETLQRHIVAFHLGAKPFPCPADSCNKAFDTAEHLRQHQRVNHDPHRYSCGECLAEAENDQTLSELGKQKRSEEAYFATFSEFQVHLREAHPPTCQLCKEVFSSSKLLLQHQEVDHDMYDSDGEGGKDRPYLCDIMGCDKRYTTQGHLEYHFKNCHFGEQPMFYCAPGGQKDTATKVNGVDITFLPLGTQLNYPQGTNGHIVGCNKSMKYKSSLVNHVKNSHWGNAAGVTKSFGKMKAAPQPDSSSGGKGKTAQAMGPSANKGTAGLRGAAMAQATENGEAYGGAMGMKDRMEGSTADSVAMGGYDRQGGMQGNDIGLGGGKQGDNQSYTSMQYPSQFLDQLIPETAFPVFSDGGLHDLAEEPASLTGNETMFNSRLFSSDYPELE